MTDDPRGKAVDDHLGRHFKADALSTQHTARVKATIAQTKQTIDTLRSKISADPNSPEMHVW
jgi:hypothetical protein